MKHTVTLIVVLAACGGDVPATPTWFADVQPILRANCARCHGADPASTDKPFRLDRFVADAAMPGDDAAEYVASIAAHAVDLEAPAMPPDYLLTDRQQQILVNWVEHCARAGLVECKGTRDNRPGEIALVTPLTDLAAIDQTLSLTYRAWDDDLDGLIVQLVARDLDTNVDWVLGAPTGGGMRTVVGDAGTLPSKHTFEIHAIIDDGFADDPAVNRQNTRVLVPELYVDHGAKGTAPTVTLLTPNGSGAQLGAIPVTWAATDPDVDINGTPDVLTIDLELVPYDTGSAGTPIPMATNLANTGSFTWTIPNTVPVRDVLNQAIPYRVRVTATDTQGVPNNVRSDESDLTFTIEESVVTQYRWSDVKPVFVQYCGTSRCHDRDGVAKRPDFCALQYQQGEDPVACDPATDKGVFEYRSLVLSEVSASTMPPGGNPSPSTMERAMVIDWLRGGAPPDGGQVDAVPTFTWIAPGSTTLVASGGSVTLQWTVADAEGLAGDEIQYAQVPGTGPQCSLGASTCGNYAIADAAWKPVTMGSVSGTSQQRSHAWTTPAEGAGCYCVRGRVTDSAMQTSAFARATRPVKF